jgi:hypothetical protein
MGAAVVTTAVRKKFPEKLRVNWLLSMLWGGVVMLAVEHISHREVMPYPPFLTAGLPEVLPEALRVGIPMLLAVVAIWAVMVMAANFAGRKIKYTATGVISN